MSHTVSVHILDPDVTVKAGLTPGGRLSVDVVAESGDVAISITCASMIGDRGLFPDPVKLASQLEGAARQLRLLAEPVDPGDHFVRPVAGTAA